MSRRPGKHGTEKDEQGLTSEDRRIWGRITGTVTPPRVRKAARVIPGALTAPETVPVLPRVAPPSKSPPRKVAAPAPVPVPVPVASTARARSTPEALEPRRQRRLSRERDPIEARIDLHGFGRFEAEDQLKAFLSSSQARGLRAVLVITGQGRRGGGVIRASIVEWLQSPGLRRVVSGFSSAHRRHGGDGAFYVTLRVRD